MSQLHGALQYEPCLRHWTFRGVYEQDNAVDHLQDAFYLTAEIRVTGGVDNIDFYAVPVYGGVFREDRNTSFPFQIAGVHNAFAYRLIFVIRATLLQHFVNECSFAVVNVRDDGDVAQIFSNQSRILSLYARELFLSCNRLQFHAFLTYIV